MSSLDPKDWGRLVAFDGPRGPLLRQMDLLVSRKEARDALGREPDFLDARAVSWGRLTLDECQRLVLLEADTESHDDAIILVGELFAFTSSTIVTLYYADRYHGDVP